MFRNKEIEIEIRVISFDAEAGRQKWQQKQTE